jgi:hypothetical protein
MKTIAWMSFVILLGSFLARPIIDPDIWWHINVGRWIVAHREVPYVDYWNTFAVGTPWRAYSWSNEVIYALVDNLWGHTGLGALQLVLGILLAFTFHVCFSNLSGSNFIGAMLSALTLAACRGHFSLRPQTTVWILFLLILWVSEACKRRGSRPVYLLSVFLLGMLWANSHLSAVFGVLGLLLWPLNLPLSRNEVIGSFKLTFVFVLGTLVTPYLGGEWLTLLAKSDHVFAFNTLDEFSPANLMQATTAVVLFQVVALVVLSFSSNCPPRFGGILLSVITLVVGLLAVKFLPFASISVAALTAIWLRDGIVAVNSEKRNGLLQGLIMARSRLNSLQPQTVGACAFFIACFGYVNAVKAVSHPIAYSKTPSRAVDFFEEQSLSHPVLNEFESGGYLQYRWSSLNGEPKFLVPIDGRTNVNRRDIWKDYRETFTGREGWRQYFAKVDPRTVIWRRGSPLTTLLLEDADWCRVFEAGSNPSGYGVFITRDEFNARSGVFSSSDCKIEDYPPEDSKKGEARSCKDLCGDGECQEIVCMALGCPCAESPATCPQDCK